MHSFVESYLRDALGSLDPRADVDYRIVEKDTITRNVIYVAMTRAVDHLNVFVSEDAKEQALTDARLCLTLPASLQYR